MNPKIKDINPLIFMLDSCHDALNKKNLGLARVWLGDYFQKLPKNLIDLDSARSIYNALKEQNKEYLQAAVESEIERLRTVKVNALRDSVVK